MKMLIISDCPLIRFGVRTILERELHPLSIVELEKASAVLPLIETDHFDTILFDLDQTDRHGLEVVKQIRLAKPALPILLISMQIEDPLILRAMKAGANGVIGRPCAIQELVQAVLRLQQGGKYVPVHLGEKLVEGLTGPPSGILHDCLTDREFEVLQLTAKGKSCKQIADLLFLSVKTVSTYRMRILEKLHLSSISEMMRYAIDHHLAA